MPDEKLVLVVDDNQTVTRFVTAVLRSMGYRVDTAADGVEALKRLARGPVDLIFLDLVMPRMNGVHFCRAVQQKKLAEDTKIILLSSAAEEVAERVIKVTRAVEFLPKPVREQQLREVVQRHLPLGAGQEAEEEFDLGIEMNEGLSLDEDAGQGELTSDDTLSSQGDLRSIMRDKLDGAVATALASKLDDILEAKSRDQILDLIAEVLARAINNELIDRFIALARATMDQPEEPGSSQ